ncbi:MAG: hypothetical protein LUC99_12560, partial [Clostridiales bacterium]|nr:hypothetical protein [Clostridiales bacterium]
LRTSGMTEKTVDHVGGSTTTTETTETSSSTSTGAIGTVSEYGGIITEDNPAGLTSSAVPQSSVKGYKNTGKAEADLQRDMENGFYLIG